MPLRPAFGPILMRSWRRTAPHAPLHRARMPQPAVTADIGTRDEVRRYGPHHAPHLPFKTIGDIAAHRLELHVYCPSCYSTRRPVSPIFVINCGSLIAVVNLRLMRDSPGGGQAVAAAGGVRGGGA
jgi:hypothetical protein